MVSKSQIKFINRLKHKKYRVQDQLFIAEGVKTILELLKASIIPHQIYTTQSFNYDARKETIVSEHELKQISSLSTPNQALAIFEIPKPKPLQMEGLIIALDAIRDPGNLGTIIRVCDWFGIEDLICSSNSVDCYNPKVIQATMGSIARVNIHYLDLKEFLNNNELPVFGAYMDGDNVYKTDLPSSGILILGNEAQGISTEIESCIDQRISIPRFGRSQVTESLNVATAAAILISEFKRSAIER